MFKEIHNFVFMIGLGYGEDRFRCLVAEGLDMSSERDILIEMVNFFETCGCKRVIHWGCYEKVVFSSVQKRHGLDIISKVEWVDMCERLKETSFFPKFSYGFSLKQFVPAMYKQGMIKVTWESDCTDGQDAMVKAYYAYVNKNKNVLDDIEKYNYVSIRIYPARIYG